MMEITSEPTWSAFLRNRGLNFLDKKFHHLTNISESSHFSSDLPNGSLKHITIFCEPAYLQYEKLTEFPNSRIIVKKVKALGTQDSAYFIEKLANLAEEKLINTEFSLMGSIKIENMEENEEFIGNAKIGYKIGKDLDDKNKIWCEQFVEIIENNTKKVIFKTQFKIWKYVPNNDIWGDSFTERFINSKKCIAKENFRENSDEKFRDFWAEIYENEFSEKVVYKYGQKETYNKSTNFITVNRWENKNMGNDTDFDYIENYTINRGNGIHHKTTGQKDGKKGSENFHEKYEEDTENNIKIIEKWSEQYLNENEMKKWGEKIKELQDGIHENEKWYELHKIKENYWERHIEKNGTINNGKITYGEDFYENSAKLISQRKWEETENSKTNSKYNDDGFGHKNYEINGVGQEPNSYEFHDKFSEDVSRGERITEKQGFSSDGNKWYCKIYDSQTQNYVENNGENIKTNDKWTEKWCDEKNGIKWAVKEGSNKTEGNEWKENWYEKRSGYNENMPFIEKKCEKWGKHNAEEWLEKWREEYDNWCPKYKVCEKTYENKENSYKRGYRVEQNVKNQVEGKSVWKYKVEFWENENYKVNEFEKLE